MVRVSQLFGGSYGSNVDRETAYAVVAYAHAAIRWRAKKLAEAPLMVVREDQDGQHEWLPKHPLNPLLETPSPDYGMRELLARTSAYVDITGSALWLMDENGLRMPGRLTPFSGAEFTVRPAGDRIRGRFEINTANQGTRVVGPDGVVYFAELDPSSWDKGQSLLDVALRWLEVSEAASSVVRDLFSNALFPSVVIQTDPEWDPGEEEWADFQRLLDNYAQAGKKGKPLTLTGGGTATVVSRSLKEMIPGDVLDRVETIVSSVFGVPAIVLQFHVGLQNSPWSQMAQARRMGYEDTIEPLWQEYAERCTRQLLRRFDNDPSHLLQFDTSAIRALQPDKVAQTAMQAQWADIASTNERRTAVGLEPSPKPEHDEVPPPAHLRAPAIPSAEDGDPQGDTPPGDEPADATGKRKGRRSFVQRKLAERAERKVRWQIWDATARGRELAFAMAAQGVLLEQRAKVRQLAQEILKERPKGYVLASGQRKDDLTPTGASVSDLLAAIESLDPEWREQWKSRLLPLIDATARDSVASAAGQLGIRFDVLQPGLLDYVEQHAAHLVTQVTDTTKQAIRDGLQAGLAKGEGIPELMKRIADGGHFANSRATLIARTETTGVSNGAGTEVLQGYAEDVGARLEKSWLATMDAKTRDSHAELDDGSWIPVETSFANGLDYPGDPKGGASEVCNCRCTLLHRIAEDEET